MIKLKSVKFTKKFLSVFLSLIILVFSLAPMSFATVSYPQGITPDMAQSAMKQTDSVLKAIVESAEGKSLSDVVLSLIFSDDTLSSLAKTMYAMSEENAQTFSTIGLDFTPRAVSEYLSDYPEVQSAMSQADSWSGLDLSSAEWGVETTADFIEAAVDLFTPMNDLLYTILCAGSYSVNPLVGLKGAKGYENAVIRIYTKCGMDVYTDAQTFTAQAQENKGTMVTNIISDLARYITRICAAPATMLSSKLPGIAYFIQNGGLDNAITSLVEPLRLQILGITTPFKIGSIMESAMQGQEGMSLDFNLDLNSFSASGTLKTAPFDLATLASLAFDDIDTYVVNTSDSFMYILRWLIETVKLNAANLPSMLSGTSGVDSAQLQQVLTRLFSKSTDELITVYINLLSQTKGKINPYVWHFNSITPTAINYTPNLGKEKYQRVLDGIDALISQFISESGEAKNIRYALQPQLYSNQVVTELAVGIYGIFASEEIGSIISLLGIDLTPAGLAKTLTENRYTSAREALNSVQSFEQLKQLNVNWGFNNGHRSGFGTAVCAIFRPLDPVLRMLLCGEKAEFLGGIPFYGSDGYNTAVIPLLEALGCTFEQIRTYDEFCQQTKNIDIMIPIMMSILSLTERMLDYPVYTLTGILPNLMYFINGGGIEICIKNLLYPIVSTLEQVGLQDMVDLSAMTKIDTNKLIDDLVGKIDLQGINLPELDLKQFGTIGTLIPVHTKRTQAGQPVVIQYLQSDRTGVLITLLRYIVQIMKTPGNEGIVDSFMNSSGEANDMFATYSEGISEELATMSVDETVEWLYKIFFRERATVEETDSDFVPTVIYTENKSINWTAVAAGVLITAAVAVVIAMLNRDKLAELLEKAKEKKSGNEEA